MTKLRTWMLTSLVVLIAACTRLTPENYEKIELGMQYNEVEAILGEADECSDILGAMSCQWGTESKHISIKFAKNKVIFFSAEGIQ